LSGKIWVTSRRGGLRGDDLLGNLWRKRGREWEGVWPIELLRSRNCFFPFLQSWLPKWERERERSWGFTKRGRTVETGFWEFRLGERVHIGFLFYETFRTEVFLLGLTSNIPQTIGLVSILHPNYLLYQTMHVHCSIPRNSL